MSKTVKLKEVWGWSNQVPGRVTRIGRGLINGRHPIEVTITLPEGHGSLRHGWEERARIVAERQLNADPEAILLFLTLDPAEVEAVEG